MAFIGISAAAASSTSIMPQWAKDTMLKSIDCKNKFVKVTELKANPGDLIELRRDFSQHWGVYTGGGFIINLVKIRNGKGVVRYQKLSEIAQDSLRRVNNLATSASKRGLKARNNNDILKAASDMLDIEVEYDTSHYNCEHFATECFYGSAFSVQTEIANDNLVVVVGARLHSL